MRSAPARTRGSKPRIAGQVFGTGEAVNVSALQYRKNRYKGTDPGNCHQALCMRDLTPTTHRIYVQAADLLVKQMEQRVMS